jgi:hypothetical protein
LVLEVLEHLEQEWLCNYWSCWKCFSLEVVVNLFQVQVEEQVEVDRNPAPFK